MKTLTIVALSILLLVSLHAHQEKNEMLNQQQEWIDGIELRIEGLKERTVTTQRECIELIHSERMIDRVIQRELNLQKYPGPINGI